MPAARLRTPLIIPTSVLICVALGACEPDGYQADPTLDVTLREVPTPQIEPLRFLLPDPSSIRVAPPEDAQALAQRNQSLRGRTPSGSAGDGGGTTTATLENRAADLRDRAAALRNRQE